MSPPAPATAGRDTDRQTEGQKMKTPLFFLVAAVTLTVIAIVGAVTVELVFWLW